MSKPLPAPLILVAVLAAGAFMTYDPPTPEWAKEPGWARGKVPVNGKVPDPDLYGRKVEGEALRYSYGNTTSYSIPLKHHKLQAQEVEGNRLFGFGSEPYGKIEVGLDETGKATSHFVVLGPVAYFDHNGDGIIDAMEERIGGVNRGLILLEGRYVEVNAQFKGGLHGAKEVRSTDGKTHYSFEGNRWVVK